MSDYKFEILSELVKHDDFKDDETLFGSKTSTYEEVLRELYDSRLIERQAVVEGNATDGYSEGVSQTKLTLQGRNYYFDDLLPRRSNIRDTTSPIRNESVQPTKNKSWLSENAFNIIGVIIGLVSIYLAYLALK